MSNELKIPSIDSLTGSNELKVPFIDSHTGGEPTRVVIENPLDLGHGTLAEKRAIFQQKYDWFRSAVVTEPRGSDVLVGALLLEPQDPTCCAGVIFFNNVGTLGMCGHGAIGLAVTLARMGKIGLGLHKIETPVGIIEIKYHGGARVSIQNVPSYRYQKGVNFTLPVGANATGGTNITGDIAWGGNWFFLTAAPCELSLNHLPELMQYAVEIRRALSHHHITGANGQPIDHIELVGPAQHPNNQARNFVLCPGLEYDRSPCGTGTSAKLACLMAEGALKPQQIWRQESIVGSVFEGYAVWQSDQQAIIPTITGEAYITAEGVLIVQENDPFRFGLKNTRENQSK